MTDLDATIERLAATCPCDACERYRRAFPRHPGFWDMVRMYAGRLMGIL